MLENFVTMPILKNSWNLCCYANSAMRRGFVLEKRNDVGFLAFSGIQFIGLSKLRCRTMVALDESSWQKLFSPLGRNHDSKGGVKVDSRFLRLFLKFHEQFGNQIMKFQQEVKVIIITGHSLGATTATLTALWLLSQPDVSPISVRCVTFGTPLLGNESLSQAILREKWGGSFYNVVSKLDLMPRLFFAPQASSTSEMHVLVRSWRSAIASRNPEKFVEKFVGKLQNKKINRFFRSIKGCVERAAKSEGGAKSSLHWPLGSYLFCSEDGVIHLDNAKYVVKMMQSMCEADSPASSFKDHLKYGYYIKKLYSQFQNRKSIDSLSESSYKAAFKLALPSSRKDPQVLDGGVHNQVKEILPDIQIPQHSQIPLSIELGKRETRNQRRAEHVINIPSESEESSREEEMGREEKMLMLALIVTSWGSASTAYFGVKRQKFLDWLSMAYVICLILALVVISRGHTHHKKTKRWRSHCTLIIIVMTIVVAIAAAMLGKRR